MINLLPQKDKQILFEVQTKKIVIILGSIVAIFLTCLIFVLLSIYLFISGEFNYQKFSLQQITKESQSVDFSTAKSSIQRYNTILPEVNIFYEEEKYFSDALITIYSIPRPAGVSFSSIYADGDNQTQTISNQQNKFVGIDGSVYNISDVQEISDYKVGDKLELQNGADLKQLNNAEQIKEANKIIVVGFTNDGNIVAQLDDNFCVSVAPKKADKVFSIKEKKVISISIAGTCDTRDDLIAYENNIEKESAIENISFSPESWINSQNINFKVMFDFFEYEN